MRVKIFVLILFVLSVVLVLRQNKKVEVKEMPVVRVAYGQYVSPMFVTQEKGFFEKQGIKAELTLFPATNTTVQAIANGDVDVASLPYSVLFPLEKASPGKFKIFAGTVETIDQPYSYLIVKDDIDKVENLIGKKVVVRSGANGKMQATLIFKSLGIDPRDIELIEAEPSLTAATFAKPDMAGAVDVEPSATAMIRRKLGKILISGVRARYLHNPYPTTGMIFSTKFLEKNPELADKFMKAFDETIDFIRQNDQESRLLMLKYLSMDKEVALAMSPSVYQKSYELDKNAIENEMKLEVNNNILESVVNLQDVYYR